MVLWVVSYCFNFGTVAYILYWRQYLYRVCKRQCYELVLVSSIVYELYGKLCALKQ